MLGLGLEAQEATLNGQLSLAEAKLRQVYAIAPDRPEVLNLLSDLVAKDSRRLAEAGLVVFLHTPLGDNNDVGLGDRLILIDPNGGEETLFVSSVIDNNIILPPSAFPNRPSRSPRPEKPLRRDPTLS